MALLQWDAAGHAGDTGGWIELLAGTVSLAAGLMLIGLVVRAFVRGRRYRAVDVLTSTDLETLQGELVKVEQRTIGEVVPVVLERSDAHPGGAWRAAFSVLVVATVALTPWLPWEHPLLFLLFQLAAGAAGYGLAAWLPDLKRAFVTEKRATEMAAEQAVQEFFAQGLHETEAKTGVLLFVSLLERRVIVLGDTGIDANVQESHWVETDRAILAGIQRGSLCEGLVDGIRRVGDVLAEHFPWQEGDRNEVPDRVVVRRE